MRTFFLCFILSFPLFLSAQDLDKMVVDTHFCRVIPDFPQSELPEGYNRAYIWDRYEVNGGGFAAYWVVCDTARMGDCR
ncbi:MAG: hypothetical protein AAF570_18290, partial [Bacteroidota bacterium]